MKRLIDYLTKDEIEKLNQNEKGDYVFDKWCPVPKNCYLYFEYDENSNKFLNEILITYIKHPKLGYLKRVIGIFRDKDNPEKKRIEDLTFFQKVLLDKIKLELNIKLNEIKELEEAIKTLNTSF